jgi:hypothetical protein
VDKANALGEYLRARRDLVQPEDVGLVRVGGVAYPVCAARSWRCSPASAPTTTCVRLEQGRDKHPSAQVLDALAAVLQLDPAATAHLHELAEPTPRRRSRPRTERVPVGIAQLVEQLPMPAFVTGWYLDVLASNPSARALSPNFTPGRNVLRQVFLDPHDRELHLDWERATAGVVGGLRQTAGTDPDDPRLAALVGEMSLRSERFRTLWARADVGYRTSHMQHPHVGELHLRRDKLTIPGTDGQQLVVYHAEPGSGSARALALLGSIAVTRERDARAAGEASPTESGRS